MTPPRVLIDARSLTATPTGVGNYAKGLIPCLVECAGEEFDWVVMRHHQSDGAPLCEVEDRRHYREVRAPLEAGQWRDFLFGDRARRRILDVFGPFALSHHLFHVAPWPLWDRRDGAPEVVTLHDLIWLDHARASQPTWLKAAWIRLYGELAIPVTLKRASQVICVSQATSARAAEWVPQVRRHVIGHGVDEVFFKAPPPLPAGLNASPHEYIATVSSDKPYKDVATLIRAFALYYKHSRRGALVLVGRCEALRPLCEALGVGEQVIFTGVLQREAMHAVIASAALFVFPSLVEGFGMPPIEAMACGTPTAVCDLEPMRSVTAGGAEVFPPGDERALSLLIAQALDDPEARRRLGERAERAARAMTWRRCAEETLKVYRRAL